MATPETEIVVEDPTAPAADSPPVVGTRTVDNGRLAPQNPVQDGVYSSDPTHVFMLTMGLKF